MCRSECVFESGVQSTENATSETMLVLSGTGVNSETRPIREKDLVGGDVYGSHLSDRNSETGLWCKNSSDIPSFSL